MVVFTVSICASAEILFALRACDIGHVMSFCGDLVKARRQLSERPRPSGWPCTAGWPRMALLHDEEGLICGQADIK